MYNVVKLCGLAVWRQQQKNVSSRFYPHIVLTVSAMDHGPQIYTRYSPGGRGGWDIPCWELAAENIAAATVCSARWRLVFGAWCSMGATTRHEPYACRMRIKSEHVSRDLCHFPLPGNFEYVVGIFSVPNEIFSFAGR